MYEYTETYDGRFPSVMIAHTHETEDDEDNYDDVVSVKIMSAKIEKTYSISGRV